MKTESLAVHAGRQDCRALGVHALPIDLSTTYPLGDLNAATDALDNLVAGEAQASNPVYARLYNPTVARFEQALAQLEQGQAAVAFASGMAALTAVLMAVRNQGDHVLAVRPLYGTSDHLLSSELLGLGVRWVSTEEIADAVNQDTALVIVETPANPTLKLLDIARAARDAGDVPLLVDSTFATPMLQNPLLLGASYVLHSATKFLGGHGDVIAGVVACSEQHAKALRSVRVATGALLHPLGAYLLHRGLTTLPIRIERAQATTIELANRLLDHPMIKRVDYPGLPGADPQGLLGKQMRGPGTLLAFELKGGYQAAAATMAGTQMITPAVSLGSVDSLIQHPAGLTHRVVNDEARCASGINPGLLRLSVGLEHGEDLWADLCMAMESALQVPDKANQPTLDHSACSAQPGTHVRSGDSGVLDQLSSL